MNKVILQFLTGANKELSSKRLVGFIGSAVSLLLCLVACVVLLLNKEYAHVLDIIDSIFIFSGSLLGLGLGENFFNKKNAKDNNLD